MRHAHPIPLSSRYHGLYRDARDPDESQICELHTVDDAMDAIVRYFRLEPASLANMMHWRIVDTTDGATVASGETIDLS